MNLSLWDTPLEYFQLEHPRRPFPVMPSLAVKKKGEATKCKTCLVYWLEMVAFGSTFTAAILYSL